MADKGHHSNDVLTDLTALEIRSYINEPDRGRRKWCGQRRQQQAVYGNRRWLRGERVERSLLIYETGEIRRKRDQVKINWKFGRGAARKNFGHKKNSFRQLKT